MMGIKVLDPILIPVIMARKVAIALAFATPAAAHICLFGPATQRGGAPGELTPATHACFKANGPCGDMPPEEPNAEFPGGAVVPLTMQQNLNHYSVGSRGYTDWGVSLSADPQSDEDFEVLGPISDYDAYRQWTQTNFTLDVVLPNVNCEHAVLRVRYVSNKPTEPGALHQCADISIAATTGKNATASAAAAADLAVAAAAPSSKEAKKKQQLVAAKSKQAREREGPAVVYALADDASASVPTAVLSTVDLATGLATGVVAEFAGFPVVSNSGGSSPSYTADVMAAVDHETRTLFFLQANQTNPTEVTIVAVDVDTGVSSKFHLDTPFPLSGLHFDDGESGRGGSSGGGGGSGGSTLVGVGFESFNGTDYALAAVAIDLEAQACVVVARSSDALGGLGPYVDFAWSQYGASTGLLYTLVRHEDEPTSLPAEIVTLNLNDSGNSGDTANTTTAATAAATSVHTDPAFIFSSLVVGHTAATNKATNEATATATATAAIAGSTTTTLFAMSPGPVDDNGDALDPVWQLVAIDAATGGAESVALAPEEANAVGPAHWGGGTWGYSGPGPFIFLAAGMERKSMETNHKNEPQSAVALRVNPEQSTVEVISTKTPFLHNAALL